MPALEQRVRTRVRHLRAREWPALLLLFGVAAVVSAGSPVFRFKSEFLAAGLPGYGEAATGDHLQTAYKLWLVGHQLGNGAAPWLDPYSYQPLVEPQVVFGGWPFGPAFWPLDAAFGPVVAWNVLLLAVTVAAGILTHAWLRTLALPAPAAAIGGLAFAIAPYRLAQSGVHLLGWAALLLPLSLLAYERSRAALSRRARHGWGALAAAALLSVPLSGQVHLALGAIPFALGYAVVRLRPAAAAWMVAGALGAVAAGLLVDATVISGSTEEGGRSLAEVAVYSADWGALVSRQREGGLETFVFVGWLTPLLALAGVVLLARRRPWLAALLGVGALVPLLLALGTNFPLYEALRTVAPPLRYPRVPGRLVPIADLALAGLAAFAVASVLARIPPARRSIGAASLLALVAVDLLVFPLRSSAADPENRVYAALDRSPPGRVLELPVLERGAGQFGSVYLYYALQAPRERPTGYAAVPPKAARPFVERFNRLDCGAWLPGDHAALERLGIRHVVLHRGLYRLTASEPAFWFAWRSLAGQGFAPVVRGGATTLFAPGSGAPAPPASEPDRGEPFLCDGWSAGRALKEPEGALWVWGSGSLRLTLDDGRAEVWADGLRARDPASIPLEGARWHAVVVRAGLGTRLSGLELRAG